MPARTEQYVRAGKLAYLPANALAFASAGRDSVMQRLHILKIIQPRYMKKGIVIFKSMPEHFNEMLFRQQMSEKFPDTNIHALTFGINNTVELIGTICPDAVFTVYFTLFEQGGIAGLLPPEEICRFDIINLEIYRGSRIKSVEIYFREYMQEAFGIQSSQPPVQQNRNVTGNHPSLLIKKIKGAVELKKNDILRLESKSNYTRIFLKNNKNVLTSRTLKHFEEALYCENFIRIHQSHLVNLKHVKNVNPGEGSVTLSDGKKIRIARRQKNKFFEAYRRLYR